MKHYLLLTLFPAGVLFIGLRDQYVTSDDDPNQDHIPSEYWETVKDNPIEPAALITDASGFDEYDLGVDFAEPHISMNPVDNKQIFTAFNTNGTHYTQNGIDWFVNNPSFGTPIAGDPATAFDRLGRLYYENMSTSGGNIVATRIITSDNAGQTWGTPVNGNVGNDKNWLAADQTNGPYSNYVYSTFTPGNVARSTDRGASFQVVASMTNTLPGMMPAVGPNGTTNGGAVYVVTNTGSSFAATYTFFRSTNGGNSFDFMSSQQFANYVGTNVAGRNSVHNFRTRPYPFIAADNSNGPFRGRLYLVYASNFPAGDGNKSDIFCRYSTDQGVTWSAETKINDDVNTVNNYQWHPAIWCDIVTGRLFVKWLDTRDTPTTDSAMVYASYSDNGGTSFVQNSRISSKKFRINCTTCGGGGTPAYLGDYDAISSYNNSAMMVWTDFRAGSFGSYTAYYPDFAMKVDKPIANINAGGNTVITASVPAVKSYTSRVKFTAALQTNPSQGTITFSFQNGKDSITSYPDSVKITATASANVPAGQYFINIEGRGPGGTPAHRRTVRLLVNSSLVTVRTNRNNTVPFTVNGNTFTTPQEVVVTNGQNITVSAPANHQVSSTNYRFVNWSNGGTATQTITVNNNIDLLATYMIQYRLLVVSNPPSPNIFGGNQFYDSATTFSFGVSYNRIIVSPDSTYWFRGWNGGGTGAYTSPDSLGLDDTVTIVGGIKNPIVETIRWSLNNPSPVGITQIGSEIPDKFEMYQNYPNPFNPVTKIKYDIPEAGDVRITIYDALGKEVQTIVNQQLSAGRYEADFRGDALASGIYFYRIQTKSFTKVMKMVLMK